MRNRHWAILRLRNFCILPHLLKMRFDLHRGPVHDQFCTHGRDLLKHPHPVLAKGPPRLHQVNDDIGQAEERSDLHRSVELHDMYVCVLSFEEALFMNSAILL